MPIPVPQEAQTLGYLLRATYDRLQQQIYAGLRDGGHPDVREAHSSVLRYLPLAGARMSELAKCAGISKQSIAYLVDDLCRLGYLDLQADPADGRAKIVAYTEWGRALIAALTEASAAAERECSALVGAKTLQLLRKALTDLVRRKPVN